MSRRKENSYVQNDYYDYVHVERVGLILVFATTTALQFAAGRELGLALAKSVSFCSRKNEGKDVGRDSTGPFFSSFYGVNIKGFPFCLLGPFPPLSRTGVYRRPH